MDVPSHCGDPSQDGANLAASCCQGRSPPRWYDGASRPSSLYQGAASPEASLEASPKEDTFLWVQRPPEGGADGTVYVDGSRIDGEVSLAGLCARHGWAVAVFNSEGELQASAKGRPPSWAPGIHGAELWGLLMASRIADPWAVIKVDCLSVQQGAQRGQNWASAPDRKLARAWAPLAAALEDNAERVVWMPAHCTESHIGLKRLSNGEFLTAIDHKANGLVDKLAKEAARADRLSEQQRKIVSDLSDKVSAIAKWLGQVTHLANSMPDPAWDGSGMQKKLRDSEGVRRRVASQRRHLSDSLWREGSLRRERNRGQARSCMTCPAILDGQPCTLHSTSKRRRCLMAQHLLEGLEVWPGMCQKA